MRIYLVDGTGEQAALQTAVDAGCRTCSVHHSDHLGLYLDVPGLSPELELDLLAAVRAVDPSAGTTAFWIDDEALSAP